MVVGDPRAEPLIGLGFAIGFPALLSTGHDWVLLSEGAIGSGQSAGLWISITSRPAVRAQRVSSEGRMKRSYVCVPRGNRPSTYSAPTMASRYDLRLRLSVETNT